MRLYEPKVNLWTNFSALIGCLDKQIKDQHSAFFTDMQ